MDSSKITRRFSFALLLFIIVIISSSPNSSFAQRSFLCSSANSTCSALVDYVTPNATTLSAIASLFTLNGNRSILGANNLQPSTDPSNFRVPANKTIKIPFPCRCNNGNGISDGIPIYTVVPEDGLYHIATDVFSRLVNVQQIQAVNGIPDPDKIEVGQRLHIPLPCSCDQVEEGQQQQQVVHYGHVVAAGSTLEGIARQYNISQETLQRLNNLTGPLLAGDVLDVPLRACSSTVKNNSRDYPLLVPNGTNFITAGDCVMCRCDASVSWTLQCEPYHINSSCPLIQCEGAQNLYLGNTTSSGCNRTTCAYAGYSSAIQTTLVSESTCPASGNGNGSSATSLQGWRRGDGIFIISIIHVLMLCTSFL